MKIVRLPSFSRAAAKIFTEDELFALEDWLDRHPDCGDVIRGSGGCRKMRWAAKGKGKRGGARVIYFHRISAETLLLMRAYSKNEKSDLTAAEIKTLKGDRNE